MDRTMEMSRFKRILDAYGADPRRWPAAEREAALAFLAASPEAAGLQRQAETLDLLLDAAPALEPSPALRRAVLAGRKQARRSVWGRAQRQVGQFGAMVMDCFAGLAPRRVAATLLAASFLGGVALGLLGTASGTSVNATELWSGAVIAEIYTGY